MVRPRRIRKTDLEDQPFLCWNEYVDILAMSDPKDLSPIQYQAHLVFWYESEVQNGGHLQFFENRGSTSAPDTISALKALGAHHHAAVLHQAFSLLRSRARAKLATVESFVNAALEGEFDHFDSAFHDAERTLVDYLQNHLDNHLSDFVEIDP